MKTYENYGAVKSMEIPSGKLSNYGTSPFYSWVNPLFL